MKTLKARKLLFAGISFIFSHTLYGQISGTPYIFDKQPLLLIYLKANSGCTIYVGEACPVHGVWFNAYKQSSGSTPLGHIDGSGRFVFDVGGRYLVEDERRARIDFPEWGHAATLNIDGSRIWIADQGVITVVNVGDKIGTWYCGGTTCDIIFKGSENPIEDQASYVLLRYLGK